MFFSPSSLQLFWDLWCQKPKCAGRWGSTVLPYSSGISHSSLALGRRATRLLRSFPGVCKLHTILPTYIWFGWYRLSSRRRDSSKVKSSNSDLCLLKLERRADQPSLIPFIFFFVFNQFCFYLYWAKNNNNNNNMMVPLDNAFNAATQFPSAEERPNAVRGKCGYRRYGWDFTLFVYAFIRTLRIIIKQDGKEKNYAPA